MSAARISACAKSLVLLMLLLTSRHHGVQVAQANDTLVGQSCGGIVQGSKYANAENCRTYIVCNAGVFELEYCPSGFYNPLKIACDLDYKCILDNLPEVTPPTDVMTTLVNEWISSTSTASEESTTTQAASTTQSTTTQSSTITEPKVTSTTTPEDMDTTTAAVSTTTTEIIPIDRNGCPRVDTEDPTYLDDKHSCAK